MNMLLSRIRLIAVARRRPASTLFLSGLATKYRCLILTMIIVFNFAFAAGIALADEFEDQPDKEHSNIVTTPTSDAKDAESLVDENFTAALHDALGDDGFHSMILTFAQCYGGGIMDDVADAFAGSSKPVSMTSGSKHNEVAESLVRTEGGKNAGVSQWGQAYREVHPGKSGATNNNPKESDAFANAKNTSTWKDNGPNKTPQHKTLNNGGDIVLGDGTNGSGATSYHAILFAGNTTDPARPDYWNNIVRQQQMLVKSGYPAANIKVLYGDGTAPNNTIEAQDAVSIDGAATRANLLDAIDDLKTEMNANEQLYIFISDHGSPDQGDDKTAIPPSPVPEPDNTIDFPPYTDYLKWALTSIYNSSGPYVELIVKAAGDISPNYRVLLNGHAVNGGDNALPGGTQDGAYRFPVNPSDISLLSTNSVSVVNDVPSDEPIDVEFYLSPGDIESVPKEPRPVGYNAFWFAITIIVLMTAGSYLISMANKRRAAA